MLQSPPPSGSPLLQLELVAFMWTDPHNIWARKWHLSQLMYMRPPLNWSQIFDYQLWGYPYFKSKVHNFCSSWVNRPHQQQRFGNLSYLKETQDLPPSTRVITLPQHNGKVKSIVMQTLIKWPPSSSTAPMDLWTSPTVSHKHSAISFVKLHPKRDFF